MGSDARPNSQTQAKGQMCLGLQTQLPLGFKPVCAGFSPLQQSPGAAAASALGLGMVRPRVRSPGWELQAHLSHHRVP